MEVLTFPPTDSQRLHSFLTFGPALYQGDSDYTLPFATDLRRAFDPACNPFFAHGTAQCFLAVHGDRVLGRVAAFRNLAMDTATERVGCVGFFECIDDPGVADAILAQASAWLVEQGCTKLIGPMNFSIWYGYRFRTGQFDKGTFLGDLHNKQYYPLMFERFGFQPMRIWHSYKANVQANKASLERKIAKGDARRGPAEALGYHFQTLPAREFAQFFKKIYELAADSFSDHCCYYRPSYEEFAFSYGKMMRIIKDDQCIVVRRGDELHGFIILLDDLSPAVRAMRGNDGFFGKLRFLLTPGSGSVITPFGGVSHYAMKQRHPLSSPVISDAFRYILARGYGHIIQPLIYEGNRSASFTADISEVVGTYTLYEKSLRG